METILVLSSIGALFFLGKVGLIAYETSQMDFNFDKPWPKGMPQSSREVIIKKTTVPRLQPTGRAWGWVATRLHLRRAA